MVEDSRTPSELHEAGEAHSPAGCLPCLAVSFRELGEALERFLRPQFEELLKALRAAAEGVADGGDARPRQAIYGPPPRRPRAPRDHPANTALAARSRAMSQSQRNALRRL